jgi:hypothetical protein
MILAKWILATRCRPSFLWSSRLRASQSPMLVWEQSIPLIDPLAEQCNLALNVPHLEGTGQVNLADNDVFVTGTRANASHVVLNGQVTTASGDRYRVTGRFKSLILPGREQEATFDLDLTAIGQ